MQCWQVTQVDLRLPAQGALTRAWFLPCRPKLGRPHCELKHGGDLLIEHVNPPSNKAPPDENFQPYTAQGIWQGGGAPHASLYHVRLHGQGKVRES